MLIIKRTISLMMSTLELKIPPLLLVLIFATLMWITPLYWQFNLLQESVTLVLFTCFVVIGLFIILIGVLTFKKCQTTVNPTKPEMTSSLVKVGIYTITRNPMYLGMTSCLVGWGFYLANPITVCYILGFIFYLNRFQIAPEEKTLTIIFKQEFIDYCTKVRRWI